MENDNIDFTFKDQKLDHKNDLNNEESFSNFTEES